MTNIQLFSLIFTTLSVLVILVSYKWIEKWFQRKNTLKITGIIFLLILLATRYIPIIYFANKGAFGLSLWQNVFLTDFCPMITLLILIGCCFKNRTFIDSAAPWAVVAGAVTIYGDLVAAGQEQANLAEAIFWKYDWRTDFYNTSPAYGYFLTHYFSLIIGLLILLSVKKYSLKNFFIGLATIIIYLLYVLVIKAIFKLEYNVSGLSANDWQYASENHFKDGEYSQTQVVFKLDYPKNFIAWFFISLSGYALVYFFIKLKVDKKIKFRTRK